MIFSPIITIYIKESALKGIETKSIVENFAQIMKEHNLCCQILIYVVKNDKYDFFKENINKIKFDDEGQKEYFIFEKNKKNPRYYAFVSENETKNLEIKILEEN